MLRVILIAVFALVAPMSVGPTSDSPTQTPKDEIGRRIEQGSDPKMDAANAIRDGQFGLIAAGSFMGSGSPPGVQCRTPYKKAPAVIASFMYGDVIDERIMRVMQYATAYNQTVAGDPRYPDSDLCRVSSSDPKADWDNFAIDIPTSAPARPPHTLYEAARWGNAADVRRFLEDGQVNAPDPFGLTALSWAVARNNLPAVNVLLSENASPWLGKPDDYSAVFWAAALGRSKLFAQLSMMPGRPFEGWSRRYIAGAVRGGDKAILTSMLSQPHERAQSILMMGQLPSADIMALLIKDDPTLADDVLWKAVAYPTERPDLVELALSNGADPNRQGTAGPGYGTALGETAKGIGEASLKIVDMLLKAGADPNLISHRDRPIWIAVGMLKLGHNVTEVDERAMAIFKRLRKAGADLSLPNDEGLPSVWGLLFPYRYDRGKLDASFITPSLLEMLVTNGLDLNAEWKGQRVLTLVEKQAGPTSELAVTLKRLGAKR